MVSMKERAEEHHFVQVNRRHSSCVLLKQSAKVQPLSQKEECSVQRCFLELFLCVLRHFYTALCTSKHCAISHFRLCVNDEELCILYLAENVINSPYEKWNI